MPKRYKIDPDTGGVLQEHTAPGKVSRFKVGKPKVTRKKVPKTGAKYAGDVPKSQKTTKGGTYPTYGKKTATAKSFRQAFRDARKAGKSTFTWKGRKYTTELAKPKKKTAMKKKNPGYTLE